MDKGLNIFCRESKLGSKMLAWCLSPQSAPEPWFSHSCVSVRTWPALGTRHCSKAGGHLHTTVSRQVTAHLLHCSSQQAFCSLLGARCGVWARCAGMGEPSLGLLSYLDFCHCPPACWWGSAPSSPGEDQGPVWYPVLSFPGGPGVSWALDKWWSDTISDITNNQQDQRIPPCPYDVEELVLCGTWFFLRTWMEYSLYTLISIWHGSVEIKKMPCSLFAFSFDCLM